MTSQSVHGIDPDARGVSDALSQLLKSGGTLGDAYWGTTVDEREALYRMGYGLYEQGRYSDAFKVFSLLVMQDHLEPRYVFSLGCSCQMLERYTDALQHYMVAAVAWVEDPRPILHAAECLIAMSRFSEARDSLALVLEMCADDTQGPAFMRAQVLRLALQRKQPTKDGASDDGL
ncbi:SycD/LcrH family type III secretion system chaperone [Bordetella tumulicola]|uniref:SycD/LcrH family type III secretion system chaperone n=1 Tax=Bordetella tumulicola TaxID=1649133 RepID=UPI0039EDFD45